MVAAIFILLLATTPGGIKASIGFNDAIFPEIITAGEALAQGSAYSAHADDSGSIYYNPSGLGSVRNTHLHLNNIQLESNKGWANTYLHGDMVSILSNITKSLSLDKMREELLAKRGSISHFKAQAMPNFTTRFFSLGVMASKQIRATIGTADTAKFEYAERTDYGPYAALALATIGGVIKVGAAVTMLTRSEAIGESDRDTTIDLQAGDIKKGSVLLVTAGSKLTLPITALPTFSLTMHNAGNKGFSATSGSGGAPDKIKQSMDAGFSLSPKLGNRVSIHLEYDYKDLNNKFTDVSSVRKSLFGIELDIAKAMFFRFGYGDGYGCFGIGLKHQKLELDFSTYAIDTTTTEYRGEEDRRFVFSISAGL